MAAEFKRSYGRRSDQLRSISFTLDPFGSNSNSILFELGSTRVYCALTLQKGVPAFLRGYKTGWLTAEYAMLPTSTSVRTLRDSASLKRSGRSIEISRLIGRALRSMVDVSVLGENTIIVDCDVLNADGGTRTACITASSLLLQIASLEWVAAGIVKDSIICNSIAAISVGTRDNDVLLDIDYVEDSAIDADYNFVLSKRGGIIEIQGSAEKKMLSWDVFEEVKKLAIKGTNDLFTIFDSFIKPQHIIARPSEIRRAGPFFSLEQRQNV